MLDPLLKNKDSTMKVPQYETHIPSFWEWIKNTFQWYWDR